MTRINRNVALLFVMCVFHLPFGLMGVASIGVMYKIGKLWYNETVGLVSAAFIASLQYTILYNPIGSYSL